MYMYVEEGLLWPLALVLQAVVAMHSSARILFAPHSAHSGAEYMYWYALGLHTTRKPDSS